MTIVTVLFGLLVAAHIAVGLVGFAAMRVRWTPRGIAAVLVAGWLSSSAHAQTFERVGTPGGFNRIQVIVAVADLNGDGRDDIIAGGQPNDGSETVEDRLDKPPVQVFLGNPDGRLRLAPAEMLPSIRARPPVVVTDDFNGDGRLDFAVFDAGVYVWAESSGSATRRNCCSARQAADSSTRRRWPTPYGRSTSSGHRRCPRRIPRICTSSRPRRATSTTTGTWTRGCRAAAAPTSRSTSW